VEGSIIKGITVHGMRPLLAIGGGSILMVDSRGLNDNYLKTDSIDNYVNARNGTLEFE
jgi:hypothetical protein